MHYVHAFCIAHVNTHVIASMKDHESGRYRGHGTCVPRHHARLHALHTYTLHITPQMERAQYLCKSIVHKCFPLDKNQLTHDLHDELIADLCGPLSCERHALRLSDEAAEKSIRTRQRMWYVALVFAVVLLTLFYLAMWTYRSEFNHAKDLHRLSLPSSNSNVTLTAWAYAILYSCLPFLPPPKKKKKLF